MELAVRTLGLNSHIEWQQWGESDPLWGILAAPGKRKTDPDAWTKADFYKTGLNDWHDFEKQWRQYGFLNNSCVDIGCGTGRITGGIAAAFKLAYAVDVSDAMLNYARDNLQSSNVTYCLTKGSVIPLENTSVTCAFSFLVFRHLDGLKEALQYFAEIYRVLTPKGTMMIELPIYSLPAFHGLFSLCYSLRKSLGTIRAKCKRLLLARGRGKPFFRAQCYNYLWLQENLTTIGFTDIEIRSFPRSSANEWHSFVLARKPKVSTSSG